MMCLWKTIFKISAYAEYALKRNNQNLFHDSLYFSDTSFLLNSYLSD